MATLALAWWVLCAQTAHKSAHGHDHGFVGKAEKKSWRELSNKGGCCCFEWAVYALWACYMPLQALYNPKLPNMAANWLP